MYRLAYVYIVCCPFSIAGSLFIIITYGLFNELQKPGANFVFFQAICDLLFTSKYVITVIFEHYNYNEYDPSLPYTWECVALGWLGQFAGHATCAWNMMMSVLVFVSVWNANRFKQTSISLWKYHAYVWGIALSDSFLLLILKQYGPTTDGCWIKGDNNNFRLFFFVPFTFYLAACIFVLVYVIYKLNFTDQLYMTNHKHKTSGKFQFIQQLRKYVLIFVLFWSPPIILRIVEATNMTKALTFFYLS